MMKYLFGSIIVLLSTFSAMQLVQADSGVCAGCPLTVDQSKINESHRRIANKAFNLLKKANSKIILGVKAEIDEMQTQVVAGTKFIFKLKTNMGESLKFSVFRSLPQWDGDNGSVTYSVSGAHLIQTIAHHEGNTQNVVIGPAMKSTHFNLSSQGASWSDIVNSNTPP